MVNHGEFGTNAARGVPGGVCAAWVNLGGKAALGGEAAILQKAKIQTAVHL